MFSACKSQSNSTSKDAMTVAPYSRTAKKETGVDFFSGIALAMSVLLCPVISLIDGIRYAINILNIRLTVCNVL